MPDFAVIPATTSFRMSSVAWALAVRSAVAALPYDAGAGLTAGADGPAAAMLAGLDERSKSGAARELTAAGITDGTGTLHPQWLEALGRAATAPLRLGLVSRSGGRSSHCRVNLFEGRGLAVQFERPVTNAPDGTVTAAAVADVVTLTLLPETALWPVLARSLPPFPELTAAPVPGRDGAKTHLPAADVAALAAGVTAPSPGVPPAVAAAVNMAKATVHLDVQSRDAGRGKQYRAAGIWALSETLYSVRTAGPDTGRRLVLVEAARGDIARQVLWHTLGAREFLARSADAETAA